MHVFVISLVTGTVLQVICCFQNMAPLVFANFKLTPICFSEIEQVNTIKNINDLLKIEKLNTAQQSAANLSQRYFYTSFQKPQLLKIFVFLHF